LFKIEHQQPEGSLGI